MGFSEDGDGGGNGVDCSVGTIVWVRRRNGSWWPGRILGPEELSASHLMSPRSGTPVKLLGREDASVDWYNLEKSKRVKAFRCGEFDACIEKAEASLGVPIKKREKYARREDAILHALELERKQLEMNQHEQAIMSNGVTGKPFTLKKEFNNMSSSDIFSRNDESSRHSKYSIHKSPTVPNKAALLHEEENISNSTNIYDGKNYKQIGWQKDFSESIPRMRGLQDFGLRTAPKKKLPHSISWLTTRKPSDNYMDDFPCSDNVVGGMDHVRSSKSTLAIKRKRSHGATIEESLVKKRDRRRPLHQVLQSSAKLQASHSSQIDHYPNVVVMQGEKDQLGVMCRAKRSRCIYLPADSVNYQDDEEYSSEETQTPTDQFGMDNCLNQPGSLAEGCTSEMIETDESDSSPRDYLETRMEDGDTLGDASCSLPPGPKDCDPSAYLISEKFGDMYNDVVPFTGYTSQVHPLEHPADASAEVGVSKWHMKGKRNIRNLVKMPADVMDHKISIVGSEKCNSSARETAYGAKCSSSRMVEMEHPGQRDVEHGSCHIKTEDNYSSDEADLIGEDFLQDEINGYNNQTYPLASKASRGLRRSHFGFNHLENDSHSMSTSGWEADGSHHRARKKFWEESDECYDTVYAAQASREMGSILFDVNLKVKASYQGEHVPLVSLMSRLNGKAIIGHPVQIEILEDGSAGQYTSSNYSCPDESVAHQPVWRTARRTAMQRVPRPNPVASSLEDDDAGISRYSEQQSRTSDHSKDQSRLAKNKLMSAHRPPLGKIHKKSLKRVTLSSQKTRTLSSFATEQRLGRQNCNTRLARGSDGFSGLMKLERQVPVVPCVPVKVAYSRILEAVRRPSSNLNRVRMANLAIRDAS
ncbi:hypothetical protein C4D60_Mb06t02850 [Musa balbisiana]|uniref:PWWP domain-containing protein n=2 Tax=Musaceae TaxID=4637 RepID=A0A4S8IK72_MUSBA|nr:hypothetical protein C4D60_Mb06t02850 [Musa balbisiana]